MFNHVKLDREVPKLTQLNEDGVRHYVTPEGNKYPSITTVLSEYSRQGIMEWRKRVGNEEANRVSGKASTRGTKLHKACESYLDNMIGSGRGLSFSNGPFSNDASINVIGLSPSLTVLRWKVREFSG